MVIISAFQADYAGSIPAARSNKVAGIAQSLEHTLGMGEAPVGIWVSAHL